MVDVLHIKDSSQLEPYSMLQQAALPEVQI